MLLKRTSHKQAQRSTPGARGNDPNRLDHKSRLSVYALPPVSEKDPLQFKILVVGSAETDKTNLLLRYVGEAVAPRGESPSFEVFCSWRKRTTTEGVEFLLDLRDIPEYSATTAWVGMEIKKADGVMIMYSIDSEESLKEAIQMKGYITRKRFDSSEQSEAEGNAAIPFTLVGVDHGKKRKILYDDAKEVSLSWQCPFLEITPEISKINKAFEELIKEIYRYKFSPRGQPILTPAMKEAKKAAFRYTRADAPDLQFVQEVDEDVQPRIRAASLERLVDRLTYEKYPYPILMRTFMLMYRQYTTGQTLMKLLTNRFMLSPPPDVDKEEWKHRVQIPIRLRVYNLLKLWISKYFDDFVADPTLTETLFSFIDGPMKAYNTTCAYQLVALLAEIQVKKDKKRLSPHVMFNKDPPKPQVSRKINMGNFGFKDLKPVELARQLTLLDLRFFKRLTPLEFIWWNKLKKHEKPSRASNIYSAIQKFNSLNCLVRSEVVMGDKPKSRALVIARWIQTGQACLELNNFNSVMMIVSALDDCAVHRLKQSWKLVPRKLVRQFQEFKKLTEARGSFANLRQAQKAAVPPLIPYLGMFLTDLAFVNDANPDYIGSLINVEKMEQMASVIREIQLSYQTPYCLEEVPFIQNYLNREPPHPDQEIYRISCEKEPSATTPTTTTVNQLGSKFLPNTALSGSVGLANSGSSPITNPSTPLLPPPPLATSQASSPQPLFGPIPIPPRPGHMAATVPATVPDPVPVPAVDISPESALLEGSQTLTLGSSSCRRQIDSKSLEGKRLPLLPGSVSASVSTPAPASTSASVSTPAPAPTSASVSTPAPASTSASVSVPSPEPAQTLSQTPAAAQAPTAPAQQTAAQTPAPTTSSPLVEGIDKQIASLETNGIDVGVLQQWLDAIAEKDPNQLFGEYNAFKKALLRSNAITALVQARLRHPASVGVDASMQRLLMCTLIGEAGFQSAVMQGIRAASEKQPPLEAETIERLSVLVSCFKAVPLDDKLLNDLQELNKKSSEIILLLQNIEDTEGAHSTTLNQEKIEITCVLMELGQVTLKVIDNLQSVDDLGSRRYMRAEDEAAICKLAASLSSHPAVSGFAAQLQSEAAKLLAHDRDSMRKALLGTASDQLDTIELHFQKLLDQMSLLTRRLLKLWDLRKMKGTILGTEPDSRDREIMQKIEATWDQDQASMHRLLNAVTAAEARFYAFARYYKRLLSSSDPSSSCSPDTLRGEEGKEEEEEEQSDQSSEELNRVFNYLIRIRKLQKELDDATTSLLDGCEPETGDELTMEDVGSSPTTITNTTVSSTNAAAVPPTPSRTALPASHSVPTSTPPTTATSGVFRPPPTPPHSGHRPLGSSVTMPHQPSQSHRVRLPPPPPYTSNPNEQRRHNSHRIGRSISANHPNFPHQS